MYVVSKKNFVCMCMFCTNGAMSWLDPLKLNGKVQLTALIQYINVLSLWIDLSILVVEQRSWPLTTPLSHYTSFCKT